MLNCSIVTLSKKVFEGNITYMSAPGKVGEFGVLQDHENFITTLDVGIVDITAESGEEKKFLVIGGYFEVTENNVIVIADEVYTSEDIDKAYAESNTNKFKDKLASLNFNDEEYEKTKFAYAKYSNMLKLVS